MADVAIGAGRRPEPLEPRRARWRGCWILEPVILLWVTVVVDGVREIGTLPCGVFAPGEPSPPIGVTGLSLLKAETVEPDCILDSRLPVLSMRIPPAPLPLPAPSPCAMRPTCLRIRSMCLSLSLCQDCQRVSHGSLRLNSPCSLHDQEPQIHTKVITQPLPVHISFPTRDQLP